MSMAKCPKCHGSGERGIFDAFEHGGDSKCPVCNGIGYVDDGVIEINYHTNYQKSDDNDPLKQRIRELDEERQRVFARGEEIRRLAADTRLRTEAKYKEYSLVMDTADEFYNAGKYAQAIECYKEAASMNVAPYNIWCAWGMMGNCFYNLGMHKDAINKYDNILQQSCTFSGESDITAKTLSKKAIALKALGRHSEAEIAIAKAKKLGYNDDSKQIHSDNAIGYKNENDKQLTKERRTRTESIKVQNNGSSASWQKEAIILFAILAILGSAYYIASPSPKLKAIDVTTINSSGTSSVDKADTYMVKIDYSGSWSGYVQDSSGKMHVSGQGPKIIENEFNKWPINVNINKNDDKTGILTIEIWRDNAMIKAGNNSAIHGRLTLTASG